MVPNPSLKNYPYNETSCESLLPICDWSKLFHWETHLPLTHMILVLIDRIVLNEHTELCALILRFLMCKHHWLTKIYGYQNVFDDLDFLNVTEEVSYIPGYTALNSFFFFSSQFLRYILSSRPCFLFCSPSSLWLHVNGFFSHSS